MFTPYIVTGVVCLIAGYWLAKKPGPSLYEQTVNLVRQFRDDVSKKD